MSRTWMKYWKPDQLVSPEDGGLLRHMASKQLDRVSRGDRVWITGVRADGTFITKGSIRVNKVIGKKEAQRLLARAVWDAPFHVVLPAADATKCMDVDITKIAPRLRFESETAQALTLTAGRVNGQQLQTMRVLTPESARLIETAWQLGHDRSERAFTANESKLAKLAAGDRRVSTLVRLEQKQLRERLFSGATRGYCALCNESFPVTLLVCAHIKPRGKCTRVEREDWTNIVFPLCLLGCDALFERGLLSVVGGRIRVRRGAGLTGPVKRYLDRLEGRWCSYWKKSNAKYFREHLEGSSAAWAN